ncbi:unnamed protein product [Larinioides sclopetarius]|uniref:Uncharacterized protein n=1 Tax=Larinioides sclopetarius TaxID=280406 RepID=A0AAV2AHG9_9ARAC
MHGGGGGRQSVCVHNYSSLMAPSKNPPSEKEEGSLCFFFPASNQDARRDARKYTIVWMGRLYDRMMDREGSFKKI